MDKKKDGAQTLGRVTWKRTAAALAVGTTGEPPTGVGTRMIARSNHSENRSAADRAI